MRLTHGVRLAVLSRHHEGCFAQSVDGVHLGVVTEKQLETFHMVRVGCGVQRRPDGKQRREQSNVRRSLKKRKKEIYQINSVPKLKKPLHTDSNSEYLYQQKLL